MSKENLSAVSRKKAEDRIRKDIMIKCKVCNGVMTFHREIALELETLIDSGHYYYCAICLRKVRLLNYK